MLDKETLQSTKSIKDLKLSVICQLSTGLSCFKNDNPTQHFLKWKRKCLGEFERVFHKKYQENEDFGLLLYWCQNKFGMGIKFKLAEFFEETTGLNSIWRKKFTKNFLNWKRKYLKKFLAINIDNYREWFEKFIEKNNLKSINKIKDSQVFLEWENVFHELYIDPYNIENFKKWYNLWVEHLVKPKRITKEKIISYKPTVFNFDNEKLKKYNKILSNVGYKGEEYVFYEVIPYEFKKKYPNGLITIRGNKLFLQDNNEIKLSIKWNNKYKEKGLPYDLEMKINDEKYYIEVKATRTDDMNFTISCDEFTFAKEKREFYIIYFVKNIGSGNEEYYVFENFYKCYKEGFFDKRNINLNIIEK